jgi:hypothetical protein
MTAASVSEGTASQSEIIAPPSWYPYRVKWLLMGVIMIAAGAWFLYDGFVKWPEQNRVAQEKGYTELPHGGYDIPLQRTIGFALPPLGVFAMCWCLYHSRGQYRLAGDTLYVPGHPPVPLDAIQTIDKTKWDRKGIAYLAYELPGGKTGTLTLDDYIYERKPTDDILEKVEAHVAPPTDEGAESAEAGEVGSTPEEQVRS